MRKSLIRVMDKDLKDVLVYGLGSVVGFVTIISGLYVIVRDVHLILIYSMLLTILFWLAYLNKKVTRIINFINKRRMEEEHVKRGS